MKTILVADDDIISRKVVKSVCESLGYKVLESDNGEKALKTIREKHVDILVSDWIMPKMDGLSLCEKVRGETGEASPFIFLITGKKKGLKNYANALASGADDFLYKPVDAFVFRNQLQAAEKTLGF
jgi:CheY-like chemotaxis protein